VAAGPGDASRSVGRRDPEIGAGAVERSVVVGGLVRWLYEYQDQRSVGVVLPLMERLLGPVATDRASLIVLKVRADSAVPAVAARLRVEFPSLEVNSVAQLVVHFRERLV